MGYLAKGITAAVVMIAVAVVFVVIYNLINRKRGRG